MTEQQTKPGARQGQGRAGAGRQGGGGPRRGGGDSRGRRPGGGGREPREFDQKTLDLARVTRVTAGGKRMRFRAAVVVGDHKGRVGLGVAKGADVAMAMEKAYRLGKKHLLTVALKQDTFPHASSAKHAAAEVLLMPAPRGTGLKAGGAVRIVLEMAGVPNASSKILRSSNKINIARAALAGLAKMHVTSYAKA